MARKAARKQPSARQSAGATPSVTGSDRDRIIAAFMALLGEKPIERIGLTDIADAAGVSLAALRDEFASKLAILAAHVKSIDRKVLAGGDADMAEESPRERLFDVLMRRLEAMAEHKSALRSLMRSAACNPCLALELNELAVRSQQWMLAAAGITAGGPKGLIRAQGLALMFARVLRIFVDDENDNARTMAALDRALASGQRWSGLLDDLCRFVPRPRRRRRRRDESDEAEATAI